jgi:hypothetical protein
MKTEPKPNDCCNKVVVEKHHCHHHGGGSGAIYGLGVIGSLFYFLQHATSFIAIVTGIGKAFFWPAILIFRVLTDLNL